MDNKVNITDSEFVQEALYDKFKKLFATDAEATLLTPGNELWIGDIGCLTSEIKNQGTKSGEVIKNVKVKFVPSKKFRKKINQEILGK